MASRLRDIDRRRLRASLLQHLEDYPRQLDVLRYGFEQFDLPDFERAYVSRDPEVYMPVQAIERGFGRIQNYTADMAVAGARLAELRVRTNRDSEPRAQPAFEALRDANAITATLCRGLIASQKSRSLLEHDYVRIPGSDVYAAVAKLVDIAPRFLAGFATWVEAFLLGPDLGRPAR